MNQSRPLLEAEAQRIEHAVDVPLRARPSLYSKSRRFVQDDDVVVPVDDQVAISAASRSDTVGISRGLGGGEAVTRAAGEWSGRLDASLPSARRPSIRTCPCAKALQSAVAQLGKMPLEPAIEPQPGLLLGDRAHRDTPAHRARFVRLKLPLRRAGGEGRGHSEAMGA